MSRPEMNIGPPVHTETLSHLDANGFRVFNSVARFAGKLLVIAAGVFAAGFGINKILQKNKGEQA